MTQNVQWPLLLTSFVVSVYLQEVRGYSATKTGVAFTAATAPPVTTATRPAKSTTIHQVVSSG